MRRIFMTLVLAGAVSTAPADVLELKDGGAVDGTYLGGDRSEVKFMASDGTLRRYSIENISNIRLGAAEAEKKVATRSRAAVSGYSPKTIPMGTVVAIRMIDSVEADFSAVGSQYRASVDEAIVVDGEEIVSRGADAMVEITRVQEAGKVKGRDEITMALASVMVGERVIALNSEYAEVKGKSKGKQTAKTTAITTGIGAAVGAILGGGKGAAIGAGAGAGAGVLVSAVRGEKLNIPSETELEFTLREPVTVASGR